MVLGYDCSGSGTKPTLFLADLNFVDFVEQASVEDGQRTRGLGFGLGTE